MKTSQKVFNRHFILTLKMEWTTSIGLLGGMLTTIAFLPQVIKSWQTKKTKDISFWMYLILVTGIALWLIYGISIKNLPIIFANTITFILAFSVLMLKIKHN